MIKFKVTKVTENAEGEAIRTSAKHYTCEDCTIDDVIEWFEDKYRTDGIDRGNGAYYCTQITDKGFITYILEFI